MFSQLNTIAIQGIEPIIIDVQIHITSGNPCFIIVGLPDKTIAESKERVRAAITSIGINFPQKRIIVNLSPADLYKGGSHYDLAIAVGIIAIINIKISEKIKDYIFMGEISLDGNIMPVSGIIPASIKAKEISKGIVCPWRNAPEALFSKNPKIVALSSLKELIAYLKGENIDLNYNNVEIVMEKNCDHLDIKDVIGQKIPKRGLMIAAAGRHNIIMQGPPGTGKTMLAKRLLSISPNLSDEEIMAINMIASTTNSTTSAIKVSRPFREPHHSCSMAAMVGGGKFAKPGEVTLAHKGILFLDELPEFCKQVLDSLRQPLESKSITVSRVNAKCTYPADFQLIAAMNQCRCGHFGNVDRMCNKAPLCVKDYVNKISGPLLDRIDININVGNVEVSEIQSENKSESSAEVRSMVISARQIQSERYKGLKIQYNSDADGDLIDDLFFIENDAKKIATIALQKNQISTRGYKKILRIARTIADLKGEKNTTKDHVLEALHYRLNY